MATIAEVAEHLDLSERRIYELQAKGIVPKDKPGAINLTVARLGYIRHLREHASGRVPQGELDPSQELARKNRALAIAAEIRNDLMTGKVVLIDDAIAIMTGGLARVRNKVLGLATRVAPRLVMQREAEPIRALIYDEVIAILEELSVEHDVRRLAGEGAGSEASA